MAFIINITPPTFPTTYNRIVMNYSPTDPNQLYFLANTPGFGSPDTNFLKQVEWNSLWKYTYLSGDGDSAGGRWINLSANLPHSGGTFDKYNCQGSYDMVVSFCQLTPLPYLLVVQIFSVLPAVSSIIHTLPI